MLNMVVTRCRSAVHRRGWRGAVPNMPQKVAFVVGGVVGNVFDDVGVVRPGCVDGRHVVAVWAFWLVGDGHHDGAVCAPGREVAAVLHVRKEAHPLPGGPVLHCMPAPAVAPGNLHAPGLRIIRGAC